jgi:hypothetical protein
VSFRLVEEVLAGMPADTTLAERLVLLVLAHHADEKTRECWPGMDTLCARTGLHRDSVRRSLTKLASRGIDLRVSTASRGHRTVYRIPPLRQSQDATSYQPASESQDATSALSDQSQDAASALVGRSVRESQDATSAPEGQEPREPSSDARARTVDDDARSEEMRKNTTVDPQTELLARLSQWHGDRAPDALAEALRQAHAHAREPIGNPIRYVAAWPDDRLAAIKIPKPSRPPCTQCDNGWIYGDPADPGSARKCDHVRMSA